jgi:hypothetical protein
LQKGDADTIALQVNKAFEIAVNDDLLDIVQPNINNNNNLNIEE